jgi:polo-like kinase 4
MSNEPEADIEVLLGAELPAARMKTTGHAKTAPTTEHSSAGASMRVRVSRKQEVVEIARYVRTYAASDKTGRRQGEWVKKVIHLHQILDNEVARSINLDQAEWDGINKTFEFMAICHTIESGMYSTSPSGKDDVANTKSIPGSTKGRGSRMASTATLGSRESLTLRVASDQHLNQHPEDPSASLDHLITSLEDIRVRVAASSVNTAMDEQFIQTRFLADVGWCLRYGMRGLRYRLMFLDGMTMEIDVEKEHVEFMNRRGEVVRYGIVASL